MTRLPSSFLTRPLAHRGLHDLARGIPENSLAAATAAMAHGYGIELDVQPSRDGVPMMFHDDDLDRLTDATGPTRDLTAAELSDLNLLGTDQKVPDLFDVLRLVDGKVPLLIEIKDQRGCPSTDTNPLVEAVLARLEGYPGEVALMSFNPFAVAHGSSLRPDLPFGVTTGHGTPLWPEHPELDARVIRSPIDPVDHGASFVSHGLHDMEADWVAALPGRGIDVLSWTVKSPEDEMRARKVAANITFEGYLAPMGHTALDQTEMAAISGE